MSSAYFGLYPLVSVTFTALLAWRLPFHSVDLPHRAIAAAGWLLDAVALGLAHADLGVRRSLADQPFYRGLLQALYVLSVGYQWVLALPAVALAQQAHVVPRNRVLSAAIDTALYFGCISLCCLAIPLTILAARDGLNLQRVAGLVFGAFNCIGLIYLALPFMYGLVEVPRKQLLSAFPRLRWRSALRTAARLQPCLVSKIGQLNEYEARLTAALPHITDPVARSVAEAALAARPPDLGAPVTPGRVACMRKQLVDAAVELEETQQLRPLDTLDDSEFELEPSPELRPGVAGADALVDAAVAPVTFHWRHVIYGSPLDVLLTQHASALGDAIQEDCAYRRALRRAARALRHLNTSARAQGVGLIVNGSVQGVRMARRVRRRAALHGLWLFARGLLLGTLATGFSLCILVSEWMFALGYAEHSPLALFAAQAAQTGPGGELWVLAGLTCGAYYYLIFGLGGGGEAKLHLFAPAPPHATLEVELVEHADHLTDTTLPLVWNLIAMCGRAGPDSVISGIVDVDENLPLFNLSTTKALAGLMTFVAVEVLLEPYLLHRHVPACAETKVRADVERYVGEPGHVYI